MKLIGKTAHLPHGSNPVGTASGRDYETEAQQAAEAHLEACWVWLDHEEYGSDPPEGMTESPAWAPFDGCLTCEVRETLHAVWPIIAESTSR